MYSIILLERSRTLLHSLTFLRHMGGGPRTFPGGINKWQWKRLHEKKAKEKEKRLLDQEKQVYQARIRSDIRSKLSDPQKPDPNDKNYNPISPKEHIKALADRFMKEGAEDLWNEADGPIKSIQSPADQLPARQTNDQSVNLSESSPIDLQKIFRSNRNVGGGNKEFGGLGGFGNWSKPRHYSVGVRSRKSPKRYSFRGNDSSSSGEEDDGDSGLVRKNVRWPRFGGNGRGIVEEEEEDEEEEEMGGKRGSKKMMSSAALGNYDKKIKRRVPLQFLEDEDDLSQHVEVIKKEVSKRIVENDEANANEESMLSEKRFDECNVSPLTVKALTSAGYIQMTKVQEATLAACLEGKDVLVKAKTGTGKSVAFLLPAIETVLKASSSNSLRISPIYVLILCPTRELASQIAAEANVLIKLHSGIGVQTLIGGTRFKVDQKRLESDPCQIIVATPGRLLDHIENKSGFSARLMGLKMLILDEADHLLDLGFRKDMEKIVDCLPRQRHSLLFSATIPKEVRRISQLVLKREHAYIDTVGLGCVETPVKVRQSYLVVPHEQHFEIVHHLLKEHTSQELDYKVIVFCTTAMMTSLMFTLFRELKFNVRELHSRKPQLYRTRISDEFKESKRLILITSDVSARGMNYPDVTLVLQVGIPSDREQYIHRLGRTGREGKAGEGVLLIAPWEDYFLDEIKDLPLEKSSLPRLNPDVKAKVDDSMAKMDSSIKEAAYHAWLGYYNSNGFIGRDKTTLVELANKFCESIKLEKPPALFRKTALKMGLKDIAGIRIRK